MNQTPQRTHDGPIPALRPKIKRLRQEHMQVFFSYLVSWMQLLFLRGLGRGLLLSTGAAEGVRHGVVALMARIFEILIAGFLCQRERDLERSRECFRIVDGYFVLEPARTCTRIALDQFQCITRGGAAAIEADSRLVAQKIRCLDDQRVLLPVAARIAHVGTDARTRMRTAVHWDHAGFMDHFLQNRHVAGRLHNLLAISIDNREYGARHATADAADVIAEVFPRVAFRVVVIGSLRDPSGLGLRKQVWCPAIRRIYDERRLPAGPPRSLDPVTRRSRAHPLIGRHDFLQIVLLLLGEFTLALSEFPLRIVEFLAEIGGPVQGSADAVITRPCSLQIRVAPRRLRWCPALGPGRGFGGLRAGRLRCQRTHGSQNHHSSGGHSKSVSHTTLLPNQTGPAVDDNPFPGAELTFS